MCVQTASVELITHNGEVVYSLTKPNPSSRQNYSSTDHYRNQPDGAPQKRYVPYKKPVTAPQVAPNADSGSLWTILGGLLILTVVVGGLVTAKMKSGGAAGPKWFDAGKRADEGGIYGGSSDTI